MLINETTYLYVPGACFYFIIAHGHNCASCRHLLHEVFLNDQTTRVWFLLVPQNKVKQENETKQQN